MSIRIEATEKAIEDILAANMKDYLDLRFVGRQINTPAGIVDILARCPTNGIYYVIELKKDILDVSAYAQVMRYVQYFNHNKNKNGKRLFLPLLIGQNLHDSILRNVFYFRKHQTNCPSMVGYRLFNFDISSGLSFTYSRTDQDHYEEAHYWNSQSFHSRSLDDLSYEYWCLKDTLEPEMEPDNGV